MTSLFERIGGEAGEGVGIGIMQPGGAMVEGRAQAQAGFGAAAQARGGLQHQAGEPAGEKGAGGADTGGASADDQHIWIGERHGRKMGIDQEIRHAATPRRTRHARAGG
jgi:hypothetical protein